MTTPPNKPEDVEQVADKLVIDWHQHFCGCKEIVQHWNDHYPMDELKRRIASALSSERAKQREKDARIAESICQHPHGFNKCDYREPSQKIAAAIRKAGGG